ncbi:acyl-CoA:lysophosphatidylglycerol acyltransferase 1 [Ciona intestinalis]
MENTSKLKTNEILRFMSSVPLLVVCVVQNLIFPLLYVLLLILMQPLRLVRGQTFWWVEGMIYDSYLAIVSSWSDQAGHTILESGDDISKITEDESLLLLNHQSPSDIGTIMRCLHGKNFVFSRTIWVMDWLFQFLNFGWVSKCHGDFFLLQPTDARRLPKWFVGDISKSNAIQQTRLSDCVRNNFSNRNRKWVIVFPEGGFLSKRRSGSQRFARKNDLPILEHVALPRSGAVQCILDTLGVEGKYPGKNGNSHPPIENSSNSHPIKWIVDVTIGYNRPISILEHIMGHHGPVTITVHYRIFPAHEVFKTKDKGDSETIQVTNWLYHLYYEKEKMLSYFYANGCFPSKSGGNAPTRATPLLYTQLFLIHVFGAVGVFFTYCLFYLIFS